MKLPAWLKVINGTKEEGEEPIDLLLSDDIGGDGFGSGITAQAFGNAINSFKKEKTINLMINTRGGRVDEGVAMCNLAMSRGNINTTVIGFAASIGAVLLQAGQTRSAMPGTMVLIHPVTGDTSTAEGRDVIRVCEEGILDILSKRTGTRRDTLKKLMDKSTAMSPKEAKEYGFIDKIIDGQPVNLTPAEAYNTFRQLEAHNVGGGRASQEQEQQEPSMKKVIGALAALNLIPSADLTDEAAIETALRNGFTPFQKTKEDLVAANNRIAAYENAQKIRVTSMVDAAITDKLVKAERKDKLVELGMKDEAELTNQLNDLREAKGATVVPIKRAPGAPPVPRNEKEGEDDVENKMSELRAKMADPATSAQERNSIAGELRKLRGHDKMFAKK